MNEETKIGGAVLADGTISQTGYRQPVGGAITNSGIISQDGINPITSESLRPATPLNIPRVNTSDVSSNISGIASTLVETSKAQKAEQKAIEEQNRKAQEAQSARDTSLDELLGVQKSIESVQASRAGVENEQKIGEKSQRLTDVTNQIEASQRAQTNELRALDGQGLTDAQKAIASKEINRRYAFEQADLALIQSAANRDLATAQSIADRKVELALEPLKTRLEFAKMFYEENKGLFDKEDERRIKASTASIQRELDKEEAFLKRRTDLQMQALKDGNVNLYNALGKAKEDKELASITYSNIVPSGGNTKAQQIARDIFAGNSGLDISSLPIGQRAEVTAELNKLKQAALASGDITGVIKASAGGKDVSDTFTQSFEKALNVVGQLEDLKTKLDKKTTGPIVGIVSSNNPYDTKAQEIKAQLQAIVPNLARGIYGEVGVLTDNDVALYANTIANLRGTEEVNNAVMAMTVKAVQRSLENKIKVQAGFGRDVSGILDTYEGVKNTADTLISSLNSNGTKTYAGVVIPGGESSSSTYSGVNLPN